MLDFSLKEFAEFLVTVNPVKRNHHGDASRHNRADVKMLKAGDYVTDVKSPNDVAIKGW